METKEEKLKSNFLKSEFLKITPYIFYFFIFSFIGWVGETIFCYFTMGTLMKRGFLYGPICPIYGYGALILMIYLMKSRKEKNYFKLFVLFIVIFSFFEYLVGFTLEALFSLRWWDYTDSNFNLNGRITVLNSLIWGFATIIFVKFIYPLDVKIKEKVLSKIPSSAQIITASLLITIILADSVLSCIKYLK